MNIEEIISKLNTGKSAKEIAGDMDVPVSKVRGFLRSEGYRYNNSEQSWKLVGETSEKVQNKVEEDSKLTLTEDEIKFIKDSYKRKTMFESDFLLSYERSKLPPRKPEKKVPYIVSEETFKEFEDFSEKVENDFRITRNELVEISLRRFLKDFRDLKK